MRPILLRLLPVALLASACGGDPSAGCDPSREACVYEHHFPVYTIAPGTDISGLCQSWAIGNDQELWVNRVDVENDGYLHHSNWVFAPERHHDVPDGIWPCKDQQIDELVVALLGGVIYAQSTQAKEETQAFPDGVAIRLPPRARIIAFTHMLNVSDASVETQLRVKLNTITPAAATVKLAPFRLTYYDLTLPPEAESIFEGTCEIRDSYEDLMGTPFRSRLYYVLPHFHELATRFELRLAGGPRDGERIYDVQGRFGEANGLTFDPPLDLAAAGATGLTFACHFDNPRDEVVGWGLGDKEMCVMLGFADSDMAFDASIDHGKGAPVGERDGKALHQGPCNVFAFPFDD
jgi:hypothetical protein